MVMIVLAAIGGLAVLLVLIDVTDLLLVRAGKRAIFRKQPARALRGLRFGAEGTDSPARHPQDPTG